MVFNTGASLVKNKRYFPVGFGSQKEHHPYSIIAILIGIVYSSSAFLIPLLRPYFGEKKLNLPKILFGFDQFKQLGIPGLLASFVFVLIAYVVAQKNEKKLSALWTKFNQALNSPLFVAGLSALFTAIFLLLRNGFVNPDGIALSVKFASDVPTLGAHVTHDEMWELFIHSRFWYYTNQFFGWYIDSSYHFLSAIAGGVFIFLLLQYSRITHAKNPLGFFFLMISGGYMQLFFGDVENYTLTATLIMGYFLSTALYLKERISIVVPSSLLALAITFHLLAGWLLPSLAFLYLIELQKKKYSHLLLAILASIAIIGLTLVFFHFHNLPIENLFIDSHAFGQGRGISEMLVDPSRTYYWQQINLVALLFPAAILILPLIGYKRIELTPRNLHLIIATVFMLAFQFIWDAKIGVYNDWNLFASMALPFSALVWSNFLQIPDLKFRKQITLALFSLSFLHSYVWIISNHFYA
jgi:hypothetical protein